MKLNFKSRVILITFTIISIVLNSISTTFIPQTFANSNEDYWTKCDKETRELIHKTITFTESLVKEKDEYKTKKINDIPYDNNNWNQTFWRMYFSKTLELNCEMLSWEKEDKVGKYIKLIHTTSHEQFHWFSYSIRTAFLTWKEADINAYYNTNTEYNLWFLRLIFWTKANDIPWFTAARIKGIYNEDNEETLADAFAAYVLSTKQVQDMLKRVYDNCKDVCTNPSYSLVNYTIAVKSKVVNWETNWIRWEDQYINMTYNPNFRKAVQKELLPFINKYIWDNSMWFDETKNKYIKSIETTWLNKFYTKQNYDSQNLPKSLVPSPFNK